jgi:hypothetical protein
MKRIILITILIVGLTAGYSLAQMGQGHMQGQGMMGQGYSSGERSGYPQGMGPGMMGYGGYGMMNPGMMGGHMGGMMAPGMMGGYGMHPCMMGGGMMGSHMGGYGMMGPGMMGHMGGMMGGYGKGYDPEAYQKYQKEYQKYMDDTAGLRKKLHNKKFEYYEASRNPETKRETILKLEKELRDLQWELYEKAPR